MNKAVRTTLAAIVLSLASLSATAQSLTTLYEGGIAESGNTFDLRATTKNLIVERFDISIANGGPATTVAVYWRPGTSNGFESNPAGWTLLGRTTVVSRGNRVPTPLPIGGLELIAGQTYGIYVNVETGGSIQYTRGSNVFSNQDLSLTTWHAKRNPVFTGPTFSPRMWNGTVYYTPAFTTCAAEGFIGPKLTLCRRVCEVSNPPATQTSLIKLYTAIYRETPPCAN